MLLLLLKLLAAARTAGSSSGAAAAAAGTPADGESVVAPEPAAEWRRFWPLLRRLQHGQRHGRMLAQGKHAAKPTNATQARKQTHSSNEGKSASPCTAHCPPVLLLLLLFLGSPHPFMRSHCRRRRRRCSSLLPSPLQLFPQVSH
jgi:hypothetical protein